jgi:hypothetical protein
MLHARRKEEEKTKKGGESSEAFLRGDNFS